MQQLLQPEDVSIKEPREILAGRGDSLRVKAFTHQGRVRPPGEVQPFGRSWNLEFGGERPLKCLNTSATGPDKRAVDIKQDKANHGVKVQSRKRPGNFGDTGPRGARAQFVPRFFRGSA